MVSSDITGPHQTDMQPAAPLRELAFDVCQPCSLNVQRRLFRRRLRVTPKMLLSWRRSQEPSPSFGVRELSKKLSPQGPCRLRIADHRYVSIIPMLHAIEIVDALSFIWANRVNRATRHLVSFGAYDLNLKYRTSDG